MSKFALKKLNNVIGKISFFKIIEDGYCYWDEFCKTIQKEGVWTDQLDSLISQMDDVANLRMLPQSKYKEIYTKKTKVKTFEFKTHDLRAYGIKDSHGNVIIYAGKKITQTKDIPKVELITIRFLNI